MFEGSLASSMKVMFLSRRLAWTGRPCIVLTLAVGIMENLSKSDGWFATQARCQACGSSVTLSYGTAYHGLGTDPVKFETVLRALAEGNSLRATARIVEVDKDQVGAWLDRAARQCRTVMLSLWRDLPVTECQLDELWSFIHTKQENLPGAKQYADTYGDAWVWLAFAPVWRLVLGFVIGKHDQASADRLLEQVAWVTDETVPFFTSDQWPAYTQALLATYGECGINRRDAGHEALIPSLVGDRAPTCCTPKSSNSGPAGALPPCTPPSCLASRRRWRPDWPNRR